jgi:hypothetical protein
MIRRLKQVTFFVFLVVFIGTGFLPAVQEGPPAEVTEAARQGLADFPGLTGAQLGQGFRVYTVSPAELMECPVMESIIIPTNMWRFVVVSNSRPAALLTVALVDGQWRAVSIGGAGLAVEMTQVMATWPQKDGCSHRFVRIYQAQADFVEISKKGASAVTGYIPLKASRMVLELEGPFDPSTVLSGSEIVPPLRDIVSKSRQMPTLHRHE